MKIFIAHKGMDFSYAMLFRDLITKETKSEVLVLENAGKLWKIEASRLIREAQMMLLIVGPKTHESPYIGWEIRKALKLGKQIYCLDLKKYEEIREKLEGYLSSPEEEKIEKTQVFQKLEEALRSGARTCDVESYPLHEALKYRNRFTKQYLLDTRVRTADTLTAVTEAINKYRAGDYDIFNKAVEQMDEAELFEQYKMYLSTSESLVERRQSVSSFYITVNSALVTISSIIAALFGSFEEKMAVVCLVAIMGILLDISWLRILDAYGILNGSKMKIISLIEKRLPVSLYDKEWDIMSDRLNSKKYVSFTESEKKIPKLFIGLYALILLVFLVLLVIRLAG